MDQNVAYDIINDIEKYLNRYPELAEGEQKIGLTTRSMIDSRSFAATNDHVIEVNTNAYRDISRLKDEYEKLVKKKWFPQGTDYHALIAHEMGHVIHNHYPELEPVEIAKIISGESTQSGLKVFLRNHLSYYAASIDNGDEIIAECYACVLTGVNNSFALQFVEECDKVIEKIRKGGA